MRLRNTFYLLIVLVFGCSDSPTDSDSSNRRIQVPQDAATIQAGIDLARNGDTVLVADGVYSGSGNRDIDFGGKFLTLLSANGPLATTIDCSGSGSEAHSAFIGLAGGNRIVIDGFTITGAEASQGPVLNMVSVSPTIRNCILVDNSATVSGGAIRCKNASPKFINCTFVRNSSPVGGTVFLLAGSAPTFTNCIIAYSTNGGALVSQGGNSPQFSCSNIFGNTGGDWSGVIASQADSDGNLSADPLFCETGEYRLTEQSPCLPGSNNCGVLIGGTSATCE